MKKNFLFAFFSLTASFVALCVIFSACSSGRDPGNAAKQSMTYLYERDYEKYFKTVVFVDDSIPGRHEENVKAMQSLLEEKGPEIIPVMDSVENIEILSKTIYGAETAEVMLKTTLKNGKSEENTLSMVKKDGRWKVYNEK